MRDTRRTARSGSLRAVLVTSDTLSGVSSGGSVAWRCRLTVRRSPCRANFSSFARIRTVLDSGVILTFNPARCATLTARTYAMPSATRYIWLNDESNAEAADDYQIEDPFTRTTAEYSSDMPHSFGCCILILLKLNFNSVMQSLIRISLAKTKLISFLSGIKSDQNTSMNDLQKLIFFVSIIMILTATQTNHTLSLQHRPAHTKHGIKLKFNIKNCNQYYSYQCD